MSQKIFLLFLLLFAYGFIRAKDLRGDTIDIRSYNLKLDLSDFANKILKGDALIGIKAKKGGVEGIRLDLLLLNVDSVKVNSFNAPFTYNNAVLDVNLLTTLNVGDSSTLEVFYHGTPFHGANDIGGFYWTSTYAFNIGVSYHGKPHNDGKVWFPCFDNFEERSLYEFYVTTESAHRAFCNGILQGVTSAGGTKTWHWKLGQEIPSYLASVAVANYVSLADTVNGINGTIPVLIASIASDTATVKNIFAHLHNAFHIQENMWGPYKWDKVGYSFVPFTAGAMEHATNISYMTYYLNAYTALAETAIAHELSHHWFGDLVTCDSAGEMWLNEGWARYNELLFLEKMYGDSTYKQNMRLNHEDVLHNAAVKDTGYLPVSGVPDNRAYGKTVYDKSADVIHTLRSYMGDSLFFHCVKNYLGDFSWKNSSTAQLRDYLAQCSAINLNDYFDDWIYAAGFPHFSVENLSKETIVVGTETYEQAHFNIRQRLLHGEHYYHNVPVVVTYFLAGGNSYSETVIVSGECTEHISTPGVVPSFIDFIALDFDEKLQDAITDEWHMIHSIGVVDFGTAKMTMQVTANIDSSLVRVEHNWIRPEPTANKISGLHLHDKRYWTVDGIFNPGFSADATVTYNGHDISLDSTFITNSEDSLVVMYRPNGDTGWVIASAFSINVQGSAADKTGSVTVQNVKRGQYCLAIWNSSLADTTTVEGECVVSGINEINDDKGFQLFPNPTGGYTKVTFERSVFSMIGLYNLLGQKLVEHKIYPDQNSIEVNLKNFANGTYLVTLTEKNGNKISKKIIKQ